MGPHLSSADIPWETLAYHPPFNLEAGTPLATVQISKKAFVITHESSPSVFGKVE